MEEFDLKKLMSDMQGGKSMPEKDNKMKKKNGFVFIKLMVFFLIIAGISFGLYYFL